ncbi:4-hydroxy-tetrahydrodipicolinate synthase [Dokdonia pacifica]|uniref:4-hydroxy-tetrahydrodipicolinate synthase n=1 Tax=Dokdonia pacifica TaxID=1627892 RepID=A0A238ZHA5_9FLAO|nr:4-hydroxy-tetrahydrodipicolinate synthase [Dokdonia pacifica]GGG06473.1 4-hydroxy-tetrahydrodipicolinate synthase [Dokdonia pacifica]SNR82717.1 4-hydroxy-tetrahydrodipicolinate synthase [Dokdonia pacifica]
MQSFRGTGVALITPFNEDLSIDFDGLTRLIEHNIAQGTDYLVALGTTAESATLSLEEKKQVKQHVVSVNNGRLPLVLGLGGNNTAAIITELKTEGILEGFDAILSVSPYYNRPTQEGIYAHYKAISEASPLPIIMYNVPSRTGSNMEASTTLRLAKDFENIIAIKEAAGDMTQALRLLKDRPEGFLVISGDDMLALPMVSAGGDGVISVIGQGLVTSFSSMIRNGLEGAFAKAYQAHYQIMPSIDLIFEEGNPAGIKSLLTQINICQDHVRLPLVKASEDLKQRIGVYLKTL